LKNRYLKGGVTDTILKKTKIVFEAFTHHGGGTKVDCSRKRLWKILETFSSYELIKTRGTP
jgi:hypothetical protein